MILKWYGENVEFNKNVLVKKICIERNDKQHGQNTSEDCRTKIKQQQARVAHNLLEQIDEKDIIIECNLQNS